MSTIDSPRYPSPASLTDHYRYWEKLKDITDQFIDIMLNYRQSGHPGGSRSKVHLLLSLMLSGSMRYDIRRPDKPFGDRFVLGAGHTVPLVYATLATLNEAMRARRGKDGNSRYVIHRDEERALYWQDLLGFRRRGGLSGHAEASGKTLFLKANTGPSGHGAPAAAGIALALKRAGAGEAQVFIVEGEGGLTPGSTHETLNTAYGLALDNLHFLVDWNDYGIDDHAVSTVVYGTPHDWFSSHGWLVDGTDKGSEFGPVTEATLNLLTSDNPDRVPSMCWYKTRKGRDYLKYDNASHGAPHKMNSDQYWTLRKEFARKYGAEFVNTDGPAPSDQAEIQAEFQANLEAVVNVLHADSELVEYTSDRLVEIGESVPSDVPGRKIGTGNNPLADPRISDFRNYPANLYVKPGEKAANRSALAKWGAWVNAFGKQSAHQPVFLACSADLAGSTNISGFAEGYDGDDGFGWYERKGDSDGVLLPTEITEFSNAGMLAAAATVNFSDKPDEEFVGFCGASSTYGSFSYLKYGPLRLFSQYAQDATLKTGRFLWIAGHSGPETADDSRTHFGIFSPGVTQLFPRGHIINLHPWEHNEVPVLLGAALATEVPLIALHLTRPAIEIPAREELGMPSHFEAARGAYVVRDFTPGDVEKGTFFVQGTSAMASVVTLLPEIERLGLNVKIVCTTSPQLFALQSAEYRSRVITPRDVHNSTVITTQARWLMHDWILNHLAEEYALSTDHDDKWRSGGTLDEVLDEAHLSPTWVLDGIQRFVASHDERMARIKEGF
jgi:transketolase